MRIFSLKNNFLFYSASLVFGFLLVGILVSCSPNVPPTQEEVFSLIDSWCYYDVFVTTSHDENNNGKYEELEESFGGTDMFATFGWVESSIKEGKLEARIYGTCPDELLIRVEPRDGLMIRNIPRTIPISKDGKNASKVEMNIAIGMESIPRRVRSSECFHWKYVSEEDYGNTICTYGNIPSLVDTKDGNSIYVRTDTGAFSIITPDMNLRVADCIKVEGVLSDDNGHPTIKINSADQIKSCEESR